jgi:Uncharacterized conserved protein
VWGWHNEPIVRKPFPRGLNRVFTHETSSDPRAVKAPPVLDWWVGKSWDDLRMHEVPQKTSSLSAIASTKDHIAGHRRRNRFIDILQKEIKDVEIFGAGRSSELADKWDGLAPYRYSIAIENTSKPDYWTEKVADCFMTYTVPIYFGATNLDEYFPRKSFIWIPVCEPETAIEKILQVLRNDDWSERLQAVIEARNLVFESYSLFGQLSRRVRDEAPAILSAPRVVTKVHGRRTRPGGWIRDAGLVSNFENQTRRLLSRLSG